MAPFLQMEPHLAKCEMHKGSEVVCNEGVLLPVSCHVFSSPLRPRITKEIFTEHNHQSDIFLTVDFLHKK